MNVRVAYKNIIIVITRPNEVHEKIYGGEYRCIDSRYYNNIMYPAADAHFDSYRKSAGHPQSPLQQYIPTHR